MRSRPLDRIKASAVPPMCHRSRRASSVFSAALPGARTFSLPTSIAQAILQASIHLAQDSGLATSEAHPGDATASLTAEGLAPRRGNRLKDESGGDLGDTLRHDWVGVDVRAAALLRRSARLRPRRMLRCRDAALQYSTLHEAGPDWRDLPTIQCASKSHVLVPIPWRHPEAEQQHLHAVLSVCGWVAMHSSPVPANYTGKPCWQ
nr:uncharacterized protein LOC119176666 [Rhipicephalus microplus]